MTLSIALIALVTLIALAAVALVYGFNLENTLGRSGKRQDLYRRRPR